MTTRPHPTTTTALPVDVPQRKCSCSLSVVRRVCTGCYVFFCVECYVNHRRELSTKFGYIVTENDLLVEVIRPLQSVDTNVRCFNPVTLRNSIYDARDRCQAGENRAVVHAMKELRKILDERYDRVLERTTPITADFESIKNTQSYITAHLDHYKEEMRRKNDELDRRDRGTFVSITDNIAGVDWNHLIEVRAVSRQGSVSSQIDRLTIRESGLLPSAPITLDYTSLSRRPFRRIDKQQEGRVLAASDHLLIYVCQDELVIIAPDAEYRIIIPMSKIDGVALEIVDICWSSSAGAFIILTEHCAYELSPHLKRLKLLEKIQAPNGLSFRSCTCYDQILLISYEGTCLLDEWRGTGDQEWTHAKQWNWTSTEAQSHRVIRYVRFSRNGSTVGCMFSNNPKSDLFEIHDSKTMNRVSQVIIPAKPCCGFVWMPDGRWLVAIRDWHIFFLVNKDGLSVESVPFAEPGKITVQNIALVAFTIVVIRSQRTLVLFDLL